MAGTPTLAQTDGASLEEVVVTAQKREENLQDTPLAVTSVAGEALAEAGVKDVAEIGRIAPDVAFVQPVGAVSLSIRGVRVGAYGPTSENPTAVHLDGVFLSRANGMQGLFYDLQRIEILRGPQGTLYGRNATGGVVNLITKRPGKEVGGYLEVEGGNYDLYRVEGAVSLPVSDTLSSRVAFRRLKRDGYMENGLDDADSLSGRLSLLWTPTDRLDVYLSADYQLSDRLGSESDAIFGAEYRATGPNGPLLPPLSQYVKSDPFDLNLLSTPLPLKASGAYEKQTTWGFNFTANYDLEWSTLTAQVGSRNLVQDLASVDSISNVMPTPTGGPAATPGLSVIPGKSQTWSGEIRLASNPGGPIEWVGGLFYFHEENSGGRCSYATLIRDYCVFQYGVTGSVTNAYAGFGQATWTPPSFDKLHVTAGLRYNHDKKHGNTFFQLRNFIPGIPGLPIGAPSVRWVNGVQVIGPLAVPGVTAPDVVRTTSKKVTGSFGLAYDVTEENLVYGRFAKGFQPSAVGIGSSPIIKPERITSYELGTKNRFLNGRLQVNIDLWRYNYHNIAQVVATPSPTPPVPVLLDLSIVSIGQVTYEGASLDTQWALTSNDRLGFYVQYMPTAKLKDYVIPALYPQVPLFDRLGRITNLNPQNYSGTRFPDAPKWTGRVDYSHTFQLESAELEIGAALRFQGKNKLQSLAYPDTNNEVLRDGYAMGDIQVNYRPSGGAWTIGAYVNNVTDEVVPHYYGTYQPTTGFTTASLLPPRTFGVIVRATFGGE
jgi:iron complex outermembrane receptor protein